MRELKASSNPQPKQDRQRGRVLARFGLGQAQIFAAGLGLAFLIHTGPTSGLTIATVSIGLALAFISVLTRRVARRREPNR